MMGWVVRLLVVFLTAGCLWHHFRWFHHRGSSAHKTDDDPTTRSDSKISDGDSAAARRRTADSSLLSRYFENEPSHRDILGSRPSSPISNNREQQQQQQPYTRRPSTSMYSNSPRAVPTYVRPSYFSETMETTESPAIQLEKDQLAQQQQQDMMGELIIDTDLETTTRTVTKEQVHNPWYFDYDSNPGEQHGPGILPPGTLQPYYYNNGWGSVTRPPVDYWTEFTDHGHGPWQGALSSHRPLLNRCDAGTLQSPIDIFSTGATCHEFHEVRSLPGDYQVTGRKVQANIESNKLRIQYDRRPCGDLNHTACQEPDPPHADFPSGWPGFADVIHVDFKIPSEHRIEGRRFDGEMQIYYIHPTKQRIVAQAVMIQANEASGGYNYYLQEALKAFQTKYDQNKLQCAGRRKTLQQNKRQWKHRVLQSTSDFFSWAIHSTFRDGRDEHATKVQETFDIYDTNQHHVWDPHHAMLIPSIYFYRYEGSLTEPPCGEFVSWFVSDTPMVISDGQLLQMQNILFTNVDPTNECQPTSIQTDNSVARPLRKSNNRPVWKCTEANFGPDPQ